MYQALYRKYRPRRFDDVAGQRHITETLRRQVLTDKLSHAYLFIGTRGTGKTTCARILSRAVNCLNPVDGNPCNECPSCIGIETGTLLDVVELDAASNNGVDDVREWRHDVIYSPATAKKRVFIVDEVHMLSKEAFNALLKILEEPPSHLIFILATTELHKVLPTIQSRCQKFLFKRLPIDDIAGQLQEIAAGEGFTLTPDAASLLARLADGSMRDGISLLDQCAAGDTVDAQHIQDTLGLIADDGIVHLIEAIAANDTLAILDAAGKLYKNGKDMAALLSELSVVLRDLLVVKLSPDSPLIESGIPGPQLLSLSKKLPKERIISCLNIAKDTLMGLPRTGFSKPVLEICLVRMSDEQLSDDPGSLLARIARLEALAAGTPAAVTVTATTAAQPKAGTTSAVTTTPAAAAVPVSTPAPAAPEPEPPALSAPEPEHPGTATGNTAGDVLPGIIRNIKDPSLRVFLNDSSQAHAGIDNGRLVIKMTDGYNADFVKASFMDTLKEAVLSTFGREMVISIETEQIESDKQAKLEKLLSFGDIVKIEE